MQTKEKRTAIKTLAVGPRFPANDTALRDWDSRILGQNDTISGRGLRHGEALVKIFEKRNGDTWLVALQHREPIRVDETTNIIGVVRMVMHEP